MDTLYFARPWAFLLLALLPVMWFVIVRRARYGGGYANISRFADAHLLPHLLLTADRQGRPRYRITLLLWTCLWSCATFALAGPFTGFREAETRSPERRTVILLDLSAGMAQSDIAPSRLARAKQEIEDMLRAYSGGKTALAVFSGDAHIVAPATDDKDALQRWLPYLDTDVPHIKGAAVTEGLRIAAGLLEHNDGAKDIVLVSGGVFSDSGAALAVTRDMAADGIRLHTLAIGDTGSDLLRRLAANGRGAFAQAHYTEKDTAIITGALGAASGGADSGGTVRVPEDRYYLFLFPAMFLLLPFLRRGARFALVFCIVIPFMPGAAEAAPFTDWFKNDAQRAQSALASGDYAQARELFPDSYRQGIAAYRDGDYRAAEKLFAGAAQAEDLQVPREDALYNLGNALLRQQRFDDAIAAYDQALALRPGYEDAAYNRDIAEQAKQQQQQQAGASGENGETPPQQQNQEQEQQEEQAQTQQQQTGGTSGEDGGEEQPSPSPQTEQAKQEQETSEDGANTEEKDGETATAAAEKQDKESAEDSEDAQAAAEMRPLSPQERKNLDMRADTLLNRAENNPGIFLRNRFYLESLRKQREE